MHASASELLLNAEKIDGYRAAIEGSFLNTVARRGDYYHPSSVSPSEGERLLAEIDKIELLNDAMVVVMHATADSGYPHTRPLNIVCIPATSIEGVSTDALATTLRHEAIHVHQRNNIETWTAACMKDGWSLVPTARIPGRFRDRCRINPDTFKPQQFWAWEHTFVPLPMFFRDDAPRLGDVQIKWYDLRNGALYTDPPFSFQIRYGANPAQPEHPFELLAVEAADKGIKDDYTLRSNLSMK
jgi:hypothetical protein